MYGIAYRAPIVNPNSYISTGGDPLRVPSTWIYVHVTTVSVSCSKGKPCLIYRGKFTLWLIKENGKTNHNHQAKYAKCKTF